MQLIVFFTSLSNIKYNLHLTWIPTYLSQIDVAWWRNQMEIFSALLALCAGNSLVTGEFPSQRPVTRSFDVSFDLRWINGWINNREAGDLKRHHVHYYVTIMGLMGDKRSCLFMGEYVKLLLTLYWLNCFNETLRYNSCWDHLSTLRL